MQNPTLLLLIMVAVLLSYSSKASTIVIPSPAAQDGMTLTTLAEKPPQELANQLGRKLTLKERIGLRMLRRKLHKHPELAHRLGSGLISTVVLPENLSDSCDHVYLLDGTKLDISIERMSSLDLTYRLCGSDNQERYTLPLTETLLVSDDRNVALFRTRVRERRKFLRKEVLAGKRKPHMDGLAVAGLLAALGSAALAFFFWPIALLGVLASFSLALHSLRIYRKKTFWYKGKIYALLTLALLLGGAIIGGLYMYNQLT